MLKSMIAASLALALTAWAGAASAQVGADLNISPRRVTFNESGRSASVYVFNQGDAPATYAVELVDRAMQADGQIVLASDVTEPMRSLSAAEFIQYTPRRVTLQPRESQVIRVRVRPPATGEAHEYRTHLTVTALPPEDSGFTVDQAATAGADEVSLQVVALFSISIPLIIREGAVDARAGIDGVKRLPAVDGAPNGAIQLDLVRLGANSVYGDVEIYAGDGPAERLVTMVRGVAVYPEIERRTVIAPLGEALPEGTPLRIVYKDDDTKAGAQLATMVIPGS
ncbi:fimbria/pilus periplasmic chaperone [Brevundimonas staleyi]|uniref:Fimbria/pilus periplasmic chaperone n=1 Tax=Brevundimonas staleyi TaxID=74326 RepID=A0ABW0FTZ5_9CAUL